LPIAFWDERLSTAAVERFMISDDMTRKRRDAVVDKAAASWILQGALDALRLQAARS
jgi:putative Holliday junction resolvase